MKRKLFLFLCALLTIFSARAAITSGSYYVIKNVANGQYLAGGNAYGTQGCTFDMPQWFKLETYNSGFSILSGQQRDNTHKYFGTNLYMDSDRASWTITEVTTGVYTISNGSGYLRSNGRNHAIAQNNDTPDDAAKWQIFTRDELGTVILTGASFAKGIDATPYIGRPGFTRKYETGDNPWTVTGYNGEGSPSNYADAAHGEASKSWYCAESYHSTNGFKVSQTITNLKPGLYALRAHAFYEGDTDNYPYMFVGSQKSYFPQKIYSENSMETAYNSFLSGNYSVGAILFTVTSTSEEFTIGYAGSANNLWNIFGQTQLIYYGNSDPQENDDMTGLIVNPSFESANFEGWTLKALSSNTDIRNAEMTGKDGTWLFNTWWQGVPLTQGLGALPGGRYKLTATVASSDGNGPGKVFLIVNGVPNDGTVCAQNTENTGYPAEYLFTQSSTDNVTIGTVGAAADFTYTAGGHWWYKADNFKLTYLGEDPEIYADALKDAQDAAKAIDSDAPMNATVKSDLTTIIASDGNTGISDYEKAADVKAAIKALNDAAEDATTSISIYESISSAIDDYQDLADELDAAGQAAYDVSAIQTKYDNGTYETLAEAKTELNTAYVNAVRSQNTDGADMTNLMVNPAVTSTTGWTNGRTNSGQQYTDAPDNTYMDTWNDNRDQNQTVTLPEGYYLLVAATRADANVTVGNIYAYSGDSNLGSEDIQMEGSTGNLLGNGWAWTRVPFHVTETSSVKIGFYSECGGSKWAGADDFHLYYYTTELAMKQGQLAQVVSDANAWAGKLTTTTALEEALSASAPSCSTVEECNTAISNLETTIANARAAEAPYASFNALKTAANAIADVDYKETISGSHATFTTAISAQTTAADEATTAAAVNTAISTLTSAIKTYIAAAEPKNEGEYFDITCLMTNPDFEDSYNGWTVLSAPNVNWSNCEYYQTEFDINQTVTGLPKGSYSLNVQAFQRPGEASAVYNAYVDGTDNASSVLYINSITSKVKNIAADAQDTYKLGDGSNFDWPNDSRVGSDPDYKYLPNSQQGSKLYFDAGLYDATCAAVITDADEGSLKLGFKSTTPHVSYDWTIFDNFRLRYYGSSLLVYYQQYWPQLKDEVKADLANAAYVNVLVSSEDEAVDAALAATPYTEAEYETAISNLTTARDNFRAAKTPYDAIVAEQGASPITRISANIGTGVFQYNESTNNTLYSAYESARASVTGYTFTTSSTASGAQDLLDAIDDAIDDYYNQPLNAPNAEKRYYIVLNNNGGWTYDGKAMTYLANDREDMGLYNIKYQAEPNAKYAQAFILTQVEGNTYKMSQIDVDGITRYISTGVPYEGNTGQIRTVTDVEDALVVRIIATSTEGVFNIYNTEANNYIGSQDDGVYTVNSHINFTIAEAEQVSPNLVIAAGVNWATFMSPFAISLSSLEDVTAFRITGTENDEMVTEEVTTTIPANTPVLLYRKTTGSNYAPSLSGYGAAYQDTYTAGLLKGSYVKSEVPASSETVDNYLLQKNNDVVAFYNVASSGLFIGAYRAYLSMSATSARPVIFFPEEDDPTAINAIEAADVEAEGLKDGKYLIDGQIIIVKNGVKYSANGQILK